MNTRIEFIRHSARHFWKMANGHKVAKMLIIDYQYFVNITALGSAILTLEGKTYL